MDDVSEIRAAIEEEGSIRRLGMAPAGDKALWPILTPPGGEWTVEAKPGAATRSIMWGDHTEVALVNPRGDIADHTEGSVAMGMAAMPVADYALRAIAVLAGKSATTLLIRKVALAALAYIERPAPPIIEPEEED